MKGNTEMTQPYPPQYPQPAYQGPPQQYGPPVVQQFAPPVYAPQQQQPQAPQVPLAKGTLDDYYSQPSTGGGPSVSWANKPEGHSVEFYVARDVTNADIQQQTDPKTGQPKVYRDGRPQFVMVVPLRVGASPEFPDGEARWYVRGQARDELVRAMTEAGCPAGTSPEGGAWGRVTLIGRKPNNFGTPSNVFQVEYRRPEGAAQAQAVAPAPQPVAQPVAPQPPVQQYAQPQLPQPPTAPPPPAQPVAPQQPPAQPVAPQATAQQGPPPPPGMTQEQAQILADVANQPQG